MRKGIVYAAALGAFITCSPFSAPGDDVFSLGGKAGWSALEKRSGVVEADGLRPYAALVLSSAGPAPAGEDADAYLSFDAPAPAGFSDAAGAWTVSAGPGSAAADSRAARKGSGAALFSGSAADALTLSAGPQSRFGSGRRLGDFSIEFWLYPAVLDNGERVLSWSSNRPALSGGRVFPRAECVFARNRLEWSFKDFFASPDDKRRLELSVASRSFLLPRTWSRHELRFDAATGLLEYLIDGKLENVAYATSSGREGGEVSTPLLGKGGSFVLGPRYSGLLDEFRVGAGAAAAGTSGRYAKEGGRGETRFLDLGATNSEVLGLDAKFRAEGAEDVRFFVRASDEPFGWKSDASTWVPVKSGQALDGSVRGRYAQIAVVLYPDEDNERSPALESVALRYRTDAAPPPPSAVLAASRNGGVELKWKSSPAEDLGGYLIYYGEARGEYFGTDAAAGVSPLDVGLRTSFVVDGLRDGALYYFAIAAYDRADPRHVGEFSREVFARPARTAK